MGKWWCGWGGDSVLRQFDSLGAESFCSHPEKHGFDCILLAQQLPRQVMQLMQVVRAAGGVDLPAIVIQAEHGLEGEDAASVTEKTAFFSIIADNFHINTDEHVHEELNGISLLSNGETAATPTGIDSAAGTCLSHLHFLHVAGKCFGTILEQFERGLECAVGDELRLKSVIQHFAQIQSRLYSSIEYCVEQFLPVHYEFSLISMSHSAHKQHNPDCHCRVQTVRQVA
jgi:hypothetical protein